MNNIFIEGIQGAGKSTLLNQLQRKMPDYRAYREGDISPVELAWCSYMTEEAYREVRARYPALEDELDKQTVREGNKRITAYTRILTDIVGFHKDMEQYEIYNGRVEWSEFQKILLGRYEAFKGEGNLFECSFFQNSIECMMLFYQLRDEEIIAFYKKAYGILQEKNFKLLYLDVQDVEETIHKIRKERVDDKGQEMWYPLMVNYLAQSPYGKAHGSQRFADLIAHLERRRNLEKRILGEMDGSRIWIAESKNYKIKDIVEWCVK